MSSLLNGGRGTSDLGDSTGYLSTLNNTLGFQGGLFDFGPQSTSNSVKVREQKVHEDGNLSQFS